MQQLEGGYFPNSLKSYSNGRYIALKLQLLPQLAMDLLLKCNVLEHLKMVNGGFHVIKVIANFLF